jgi:hypothetical protein
MRRQSYTPSIHTVQSRRGVRQRLDRRCHAVDVAYTLTALHRGAFVHLTFTKRGRRWGLSNGTHVPRDVALAVIRDARVIAVDDGLFYPEPRRWRWIDE